MCVNWNDDPNMSERFGGWMRRSETVPVAVATEALTSCITDTGSTWSTAETSEDDGSSDDYHVSQALDRAAHLEGNE